MSRKEIGVFVALLGLFVGRAAPAAADTLTFDDIVSPPTCNSTVSGSGGLTWSNFDLECDAEYLTFGNSYGSPSGDYAAFNAFGLAASDIAATTGTFAFGGASFASWAAGNSFDVFSAQTLALVGYRPGDLADSPTYYVELALDPTQYVALVVNWTGLNDLSFISGDGVNFNIDGYSWLMDDADITVEGTAVPEPGSLLLFGAGLAALGLRKRKRAGDSLIAREPPSAESYRVGPPIHLQESKMR